MLGAAGLTADEKLKKYEDLNKNQSYLKFKPLENKVDDDKMDYVSVFAPKDYLRNVNLIKSSVDTTTKADNTTVAKQQKPEIPIEKEMAPKMDIPIDKVAIKVNKGDSIMKYSKNPLFKSILNLDIPKNDKAYLIQMAYLESRFDPTKKNQFGYQGAYQFGKTALKEVGMSKKAYMSDMNNQHAAALKLKQSNLNTLRKYKDYIGRVVNGIRITASGLAAGAHLVGPSAVKAFLEKGVIQKDGNGTPITKYLNDFSHID